MYSSLDTWEGFLSNIWQLDSLGAVVALCVLSVDPEMHCCCLNSCKVSQPNAIHTYIPSVDAGSGTELELKPFSL